MSVVLDSIEGPEHASPDPWTVDEQLVPLEALLHVRSVDEPEACRPDRRLVWPAAIAAVAALVALATFSHSPGDDRPGRNELAASSRSAESSQIERHHDNHRSVGRRPGRAHSHGGRRVLRSAETPRIARHRGSHHARVRRVVGGPADRRARPRRVSLPQRRLPAASAGPPPLSVESDSCEFEPSCGSGG